MPTARAAGNRTPPQLEIFPTRACSERRGRGIVRHARQFCRKLCLPSGEFVQYRQSAYIFGMYGAQGREPFPIARLR